MNDEPLAVVQKNRSEAIHVRLCEYEGRPFVDVRLHFLPRDSSEWRPIGRLAQRTIIETNDRGLRRVKWRPFQKADSTGPVDPRMRKSGLAGVRIPESDDDAVAAPGRDAA